MSREARRTLRTIISFTHIVLQLVLLWFVMESGAKAAMGSETTLAVESYRMMSLLAKMIAGFAIQFSAMKLLSNAHHSHS